MLRQIGWRLRASLLMLSLGVLLSTAAAAQAANPDACIEQGGQRVCERAQGGAWTYGMCDEAGTWVYRYAAWCQAAGGTYHGVYAPIECTGTTPHTESNLYPRALRFSEIIHGAGTCSGTDTGWGDQFTSNLCWNGSTIRRGGLIVSESRTMRFSCGETIRAIRSRNPICPLGKSARSVNGVTVCVGRQDASCPVGNPISAGNGAKTQIEVDGDFESFPLRRYYASGGSSVQYASTWSTSSVDAVWRDGFDFNVQPIVGSAAAAAAVSFPDGTLQYFSESGRPLLASGDPTSKLLPFNGGYLLKHSGRELVFDSAGRLATIALPAGGRFTLRYADGTLGPSGQPARDSSGATLSGAVPAGHLVEVESPFGRLLRIDRDAMGRATRWLRPGASSGIGFGLDATGLLSQVTYEDGHARGYLYGEAAHTASTAQPTALTGIVDLGPSGGATRFATYQYDAQGRGVLSEHAGGAGRVTLSYGQSGLQTQVQDALGGVRNVQVVDVAGVLKLSSQSQPAGSGCSASTQAQTYDPNGNVASKDDFNGNRVCYVHDLARNLEAVRLEGLPAGASCALTADNGALPTGTRKTSTRWHPDWSLRTRVAEPGRITTSVYNGQPDPFANNAAASCAPPSAVLPDGKPIAVLCRQVEQATTDSDGAQGFAATVQAGVPARTQSWTYNAFGQKLTETDALGRTTQYVYYADTSFNGTGPAAVGHTLGDMAQVVNPAGHVTQFPLYNRAGQTLQELDPNGVLTASTYDARGRLTSRTVSGLSTTYARWPTGLMQRITKPDGSWTFYEHDDAHRLWRITDNLGNTVAYTLDAMGNRTAEQVQDPSGVLRRSLARGMDALGRVEYLTGRE